VTAAARKICMLGDFGVGKTSLVRRYVIGDFSPTYHATIGVNVYTHTDAVPAESGPLRLSQVIWDIEGSEQGSPTLATYVHGASGAIIVGDVTRADAIASLVRHGRFFQGLRPGRPVVFALNKSDLLAAGTAPPAAAEVERAFGAAVITTSALLGDAVPELFRALGAAMLRIGA
jgi:GTPase SAR1 family protein